jgi:hypothetical protein
MFLEKASNLDYEIRIKIGACIEVDEQPTL